MYQKNEIDNLPDYWKGVRDTLVYFKDELGVEDAYETSLGQWVIEELGEDALSEV